MEFTPFPKIPRLRPEGIIVYHTSSKQMFKVLLENDDKAKGQVE